MGKAKDLKDRVVDLVVGAGVISLEDLARQLGEEGADLQRVHEVAELAAKTGEIAEWRGKYMSAGHSR